ncbi:MAG: hypothetical protein HYS63_05865 [Methylocystis sp.]|nr:hypothetical protein [Methylocystis sp.]
MTNDNETSRRFRRPAQRLAVVPSHKFPIGVRVTQKSGAPTDADSFHVTRHLPDAGAGLQYRMKRDRDGQERVAVESALELVAGDDLIK